MTPKRKNRLRRSMLFVPGANAAMLSNAFIYPADALMFDLEDAVAVREKMLLATWSTTPTAPALSRCRNHRSRVNALDSQWGIDDLEAVVRAGVDIVRLPKPIPQMMSFAMEKRSPVLNATAGVSPGSTGACWPPLNRQRYSAGSGYHSGVSTLNRHCAGRGRLRA